ncbi:response regulator transcription factor [Streptomyces sp. NPDC059701]|uniref:response regulator transcription factor n=1 Tax=Streptomyces sp. NPDC059701 TaxID=3346914 RepID=UPI0036AB91BC
MPRILDGRLSPGQLAALRLAASGYTSRQIASRLHTTETGVHLRLKAAARSLGARSRTHAVVIALKRHLIWLDELEDGTPQPPATEPTPADEGRADRNYWTTRYDA